MCLVEAVEIHIIEERPEKARIRAGWVWREREREREEGERRENPFIVHTLSHHQCVRCVLVEV